MGPGCRVAGEDALGMLREVFTLCQTHRTENEVTTKSSYSPIS